MLIGPAANCADKGQCGPGAKSVDAHRVGPILGAKVVELAVASRVLLLPLLVAAGRLAPCSVRGAHLLQLPHHLLTAAPAWPQCALSTPRLLL